VNLVTNVKRIGLTTTVHTRFSPDEIRNALENFQPARLSTVTDVSFEEVEVQEAGVGNVVGRFLMKRKGMMPLEG
jgi:hypothetical protein